MFLELEHAVGLTSPGSRDSNSPSSPRSNRRNACPSHSGSETASAASCRIVAPCPRGDLLPALR